MYKNDKMRKLIIGTMVALMAVFFVLPSCGSKKGTENAADSVNAVAGKFKYPANSPVAKYGALQVKNLQLCGKDGNPVQLAGMSTMGWQWCKECYTKESVAALIKDWNVNVLRLAMYVEEGGYNTNPAEYRDMMCNLIDICGELGIYCIVDWHILNPGNPKSEKYADAENFFRFIANKYAGADHVLYEICNEPNNCQAKENKEKPWECTREENVDWDLIADYANKIIPVIFSAADSVKAAHPIVIVGTPQWDQLVDACLKEGMFQGNNKDLSDPLPARDARLKFDNVMYAFHFYAKSHNEGFEKEGKPNYYDMYSYMYDVLGKLPVFCSEFGSVEAHGGGDPDFNRTDKWLLMLSGNNAGNQKVSFCNWSFSDKDETSAALVPGACAKGDWNATTPSGAYMKKVLAVVNAGVQDTSVLKETNKYFKK